MVHTLLNDDRARFDVYRIDRAGRRRLFAGFTRAELAESAAQRLRNAGDAAEVVDRARCEDQRRTLCTGRKSEPTDRSMKINREVGHGSPKNKRPARTRAV
jgi:hypothetical protein